MMHSLPRSLAHSLAVVCLLCFSSPQVNTQVDTAAKCCHFSICSLLIRTYPLQQPPECQLDVTWTISQRMLNITVPVVPCHANQITPFFLTNTASQHRFAFRLAARLMLILLKPWRQGVLALMLYYWNSFISKWHIWKEGWITQDRVLDWERPIWDRDQGDPLINLSDVNKGHWKKTRMERYTRLKRWYLSESTGRVYLWGRGAVGREGRWQSKRSDWQPTT